MNACLNCRKKYHCCIILPSKGYVTVNLDEAVRIRQKTGLAFDLFLTFSKLPEELVSASINDGPGTEARFRSGMMIDGRILRLRTKGNDECVFFKNGLCDIYSIRPTICRIYPYWFKKNRGGVIELIVHQGCIHCGLIGDSVKLTFKQEKELMVTAERIIKQKEHYKKHIKEFVAQHFNK